ncbi:SRPBCC family protein [Virgibacillus oceani]|uniref:Activator of Hsp90 ATPase homologue 1/2-like C-terminal domain-containing protein n=1 Tax=Virgibacillus oceani TaxID=1479511 RepID=A0A917HI42_9BACI|nr:SRPBCC domain-containing protein [Virgibacillus oceani]GGG79251.1 hypothetical protein GCM10011398_25710 [Virgibacillus oceani]
MDVPKWQYGKCENNPEVGGYFIFVDHRDGEDIQHIGHYLELEHPNRIKFTWATVDDLPDADDVTVEIPPLENGSEVTLTHEVDPRWAEYIPQTRNAWIAMLEAMHKVLHN